MMRILRIAACYLLSCAALYLCGYGNLLEAVPSPEKAAAVFLLTALIPAALAAGLWETYLGQKKRIDELSRRVEALEEKEK